MKTIYKWSVDSQNRVVQICQGRGGEGWEGEGSKGKGGGGKELNKMHEESLNEHVTSWEDIYIYIYNYMEEMFFCYFDLINNLPWTQIDLFLTQKNVYPGYLIKLSLLIVKVFQEELFNCQRN